MDAMPALSTGACASNVGCMTMPAPGVRCACPMRYRASYITKAIASVPGHVTKEALAHYLLVDMIEHHDEETQVPRLVGFASREPT